MPCVVASWDVTPAGRPWAARHRQALSVPSAQHRVAHGQGAETVENIQALLRVPGLRGEGQRVGRPQGAAQVLPYAGGRAVSARQHEGERLGHGRGDLPVIPGEVQPPAQLAQVPRLGVRYGGGPCAVDLGRDIHGAPGDPGRFGAGRGHRHQPL
jgi:hypothetical protein